MAFGPVRRAAACWYDPIIFDPQALVQNVQKVVQLVQQVEFAAQQVQNQLHELAHLTKGVATDVPAVVAGIQGQLDASLYSTASPAGQLDARFPADMSNVTWNQFQSDAATWTANQRQALAENRQLENQVYRDMDTTRQQVQGIVEASNAAPGETATVQAHNDLMAIASGELEAANAEGRAIPVQNRTIGAPAIRIVLRRCGTGSRSRRLGQPGATDRISRQPVPELMDYRIPNTS